MRSTFACWNADMHAIELTWDLIGWSLKIRGTPPTTLDELKVAECRMELDKSTLHQKTL